MQKVQSSESTAAPATPDPDLSFLLTAYPEPESIIVMKIPFADSTPPNELAVVGENKNDPSQLLLLGADGHYYAYSLPEGDTREVDPNDDWDVEFPASQELFS